MISGKETIIATLAPGECFGEMSLFDDAPRSADVVSNCDCVLLKIGCEAFAKMQREAPDLAAPFLLALGKTLAARIRADNKRMKDAVSFARSGGY
jgi:CRP-like cAMP-binding protein